MYFPDLVTATGQLVGSCFNFVLYFGLTFGAWCGFKIWDYARFNGLHGTPDRFVGWKRRGLVLALVVAAWYSGLPLAVYSLVGSLLQS